jgi:anthranilate/para-aminobenzoate synthase component II
MRVLVIDNYDSFTYNLVQYLGELGAEVLVRRNDEVTPEEVSDLRPDRIVVSPGPCTPNEAGVSVELIERVGLSVDDNKDVDILELLSLGLAVVAAGEEVVL